MGYELYTNPTGFDIGLTYDYSFASQVNGVSESVQLLEEINLIAIQYCIERGFVSGVAEYEQIGVWDYCATQFRYYGLYEFDYANFGNGDIWGWYCATDSTNVFKAKITTITCSDIDSIVGCMDEQACNYNPNASVNDNSCWYPPENYNCDAQFIGLECTSHNQCDDGWFCHSGYSPPDGFGGSQYKERYCVEYYNEYCADNMCGVGDGDCDEGQCNDGICGTNNCEYVGPGFYSQGITTDADCCYKPGCIDNTACNYDIHASEDDDSCTYPVDNCHNCNGECICDTDIGCDCGILKDALGICGGSCLSDVDGDGVCDDIDNCVGIVDECGVCNGGNVSCSDCAGVPYGDSMEDCAGVCNGDTVTDCAGVCGGNSIVDDCGICGGGGVQQECGCGAPGEFETPGGFCDCDGTELIYITCYDQYALDSQLEGEQTIPACPNDVCEDHYPYISFENIPEEYIEYGCSDAAACNYNFDVNINDGSCYYPFSSTFELLSGEHPLMRILIPAFQTWWLNNPNGDENQYSYYNFTTPTGYNTPMADILYDLLLTDSIEYGLFTRVEYEYITGGFNRLVGFIDYELPGLTCPRIWADGEIIIEPYVPDVMGLDIPPVFDYIIDVGDDDRLGSYCMPDQNNNELPDPVYKQRLNIDGETYYEFGFDNSIIFEPPILDLFRIPYPSGEDCSIFNSHPNLSKISTNWVRMEGYVISGFPFYPEGYEFPYPETEGSFFVAEGCVDDTVGRNVDINNQCRDGSTPIETGITDNLPFSNYGLCGENQGYLACNYNPNANIYTGCLYSHILYGIDYKHCNGTCILDDDGDGVCNEEEIVGCTEPSACNYSFIATDNDGSCIYPTNCLVGPYQESELICPGETCPPVEGCTIEGAYNYMEFYDIPCFGDNSCCVYAVSECLDPIATNCHPACIQCNIPPFEQGWLVCQENSECGNDVCCEYIMGCMDETANNYNSNATQDDGSCEYTDSFIFNGITPTTVSDNSQTQISLDYTMTGNLSMSDIHWQILDQASMGVFIIHPPAGNFDTPTDLTTSETEVIVQVPDVENNGSFGIYVEFNIQDSNGELFENNFIFHTENIIVDNQTFLPGDVNIDGSVNVIDIMMIVNYIMNRESSTMTYNQIIRADVNNDGEISVNDIVQILHQIITSGQLTPEDGNKIIRQLKLRLQSKNNKQYIKPTLNRNQTPIRPGDSVRDMNPD